MFSSSRWIFHKILSRETENFRKSAAKTRGRSLNLKILPIEFFYFAENPNNVIQLDLVYDIKVIRWNLFYSMFPIILWQTEIILQFQFICDWILMNIQQWTRENQLKWWWYNIIKKHRNSISKICRASYRKKNAPLSLLYLGIHRV